MTLPTSTTAATSTLPHRLDRTVVIRAAPDTVFRFFTDNVRWAAWWGAGSTIEARPGGAVLIRYPDGTEVAGEVLDLASPDRIVFTYGYVSGKMIPPGGSRVAIRLEPHEDGTRLHLTHEFAEAAVRDVHIQGWRYQLSLFSNAVANEVHSGATTAVDDWFTTWTIVSEPDRERALRRIVAPEVVYRDRFSAVGGLEDLVPHISAAQRFMPGIRLQRTGAVRHCQGAVLADWIASASDGQQRATGTNLFIFGVDGRMRSVTGFWNG